MSTRVIRRLVGLVAAGSLSLIAPMVAAPAAHARSCKWVLVSYDPTTGTSVYACSTARP